MSGPGNDPKEPADLLQDGGSSSTPNEYGGTHEVIYDRERGQHISWDTYKDGTYVPSSGHTRDDNSNKTISKWDN